MRYVNRTTLEVGSFLDIRLAHPNTSIPAEPDDDTLESLGFARLIETAPPDVRYADVTEDGASETFELQWRVEPWAVEVARAAAWEDIKTIRDQRTLDGGFPAAGKWFHSDLKSRSQQLGLVIMGASIPAGLMWKTMDGTFVQMTQTLAGQIFAAAAAQEQATFAVAEQHKAAMEAAEDPAAYDYTTGWPAIYGES